MTIDLVWFTEGIDEFISQSEAQRIYREHLERYLQQRFNDPTWQAMIDLGYLFHALRITWIQAYVSKINEDPEIRSSHKKTVLDRNRQVQNALRWL
jgi:hypothetical protein